MKKWTGMGIAVGVGLAVLAAVGPATAAPAPARATVSPVTAPAGVMQPAFVRTVTPESLFVALQPCRIVDTRSGGGSLGNGETRGFVVSGTQGFVFQGGKSGGCGIPTSATAVSMNVTAITPSAPGFLKGWPAGSAEPNGGTFLNYTKLVNITTGTTQAIELGSGKVWNVHNAGAKVQVAVDVTGYYAPQIEAEVSATGSLNSATTRLTGTEHTTNTGSYTIDIDRDVRSCSIQATPFNTSYYASAGYTNSNTPNRISVLTWTLGSNAAPSFSDHDFHLLVVC